jgi:transcriptional regulator with XRE-family HTH domain
MADLVKQFGKRVKQVRKAARLTQEDLAEKTGLSTEFISRLERGVLIPTLIRPTFSD